MLLAQMRTSTTTTHRPVGRRGFSMMMVIAVVAAVTILGLAMLSSTTLQARASAGRGAIVQADSHAESGLNRAMYYIYNHGNPAKCPFSLGVGQSYSESNVSLGKSVPGSFDLNIQRQAMHRYRVQAVGRVGSTSAKELKRTLTAVVEVNYTLHAMSFGGDVTIPPGVTVEGDVYCDGHLINNGTVTGVVYAQSVSGTGQQGDVGLLGAVVDVVGSLLKGLLGGGGTAVSPNHYTTYVYQGKTYLGKNILVSSLSNTTMGPTVDNPAGVFVKIGALDLNGNVRINGTLVMIGGDLRVQGTGNVITAMETFPAAMLDLNLLYKQPGSSLEVRGLMWLGGKVTKSSGSVANSTLRVTGAVFNPGNGATTFDPTFGTIDVKFDRARANVRDWNSAQPNPPPLSVTVLSCKIQ